jgi:hypothetical protein
MPAVDWHRVPGGAAAVAVAVATALASPAVAQGQDGPAVRGSVTGELARGREARVRATVTHPEGWRALDRVLVSLELHGVPLDEIDYSVGDGVVSLGSAHAVAGTGNALTGRFLRVNAFGVTVSTGGNRLELSFPVRVLRDVPGEARIRFVAEDDEGRSVALGVPAVVPDQEEGSSATTVILAAAAALLAGGYLGARVATHRRRPSVYEAVARRIVQERGSRPRG